MHGDSILLATFVTALVAAFLGGILAHAARLPPVVGYLLGGLAVGPFAPGFIGDSHAMSQLAEVGVMFMMFGTGLHFSFDDLVAVRRVAVPGALLQTALGTLAGCGLGLALGWPIEAGIMLGLSVSIASTVVLIKNLADAGLADTEGGRIATGWLIVEDLITVVILVVLPVVFGPGETTPHAVIAGLTVALAKTAVFVALMFVVGSRALPRMLIRIARFCPRELFQLAVIVVALGTAYFAAVLFDLSFALGAFLAGVVVGGSKISHRVAAEAIPFQDLFSIIFFASVGMMVNPGFLLGHVGELAVLLAVIMLGKWVINMVLGVAFRAGLASSLTIAAGLSQIGEFSFLIGQTGMALGVLTQDQYSLILGAAVLSIALNSFVFKARMPLEHALGGVPALARLYGEASGADALGAEVLNGFSSGKVLPDGDSLEGVDAGGLRDSVPRALSAEGRGSAGGGGGTPGSAAGECHSCATADALSDLFSAIPDTNLHWMTVPANGVAAGSTLSDLQLRAKTGAQAVALRRDDEIEFAIEADMPLCAGDVLGLAGSAGQIAAALELLEAARG